MGMTQVNMHEAKSRLSQLVEAVENGTMSEIVIARNGKPAAKLVAVGAAMRRPIRFGLGKGMFKMPDDFDADNEHIAKLFHGALDT